jgi:hypothetical protein
MFLLLKKAVFSCGAKKGLPAAREALLWLSSSLHRRQLDHLTPPAQVGVGSQS